MHLEPAEFSVFLVVPRRLCSQQRTAATRVPTATVGLCREAALFRGGVATVPPWRSPARHPRPLGHFGDTWATLATRGPFCRYVGTSRSSQILPPSKPPTRRDPPHHAASAAPAASTVQSISASLCAAESMQALFPRPMVAEPADHRARLGGASPARAHPLRFFFTPNPLSRGCPASVRARWLRQLRAADFPLTRTRSLCSLARVGEVVEFTPCRRPLSIGAWRRRKTCSAL